jgi:isochorismate synthase
LDSFAIYRLPHASDYKLVGQSGVPSSLPSLKLIGDGCGFAIAPFFSGDGSHIILLRPDVLKSCTRDELARMNLSCDLTVDNEPVMNQGREVYHEDFSRFHRAFSATGIQKLVLARSLDIAHQATRPVDLFLKACDRYPDAFVTLFSAPQCGTWLVATPEVLLARDGNGWHTMALAGTMRYSENLPQWSEKNIHEQAYVAQYIKECLARYSDKVEMTGPYTTRAGNLVHLRTDFSFTLGDDVHLGELLDNLHPTPAVCGLPKQEAYRFILDNESCDRSYYSGFSGPLNLVGDTALFVSLRCMRIMSDRYRLYAGGGILPQSEEAMEWDETAAKMQSMLSIID